MKSLGLFWILLMLLAFTCKADRKRGFETLENERELVSNFKSFVHDVWNERDMDRFEALSAENYAKNLNGVRVVNNRSEAEVQLNGYFYGVSRCKGQHCRHSGQGSSPFHPMGLFGYKYGKVRGNRTNRKKK